MDSIAIYFENNIAIDYANYQRFCVENSLQVLAYSDFLSAAMPSTANRVTIPDLSKRQQGCGSCGGGKVR